MLPEFDEAEKHLVWAMKRDANRPWGDPYLGHEYQGIVCTTRNGTYGHLFSVERAYAGRYSMNLLVFHPKGKTKIVFLRVNEDDYRRLTDLEVLALGARNAL